MENIWLKNNNGTKRRQNFSQWNMWWGYPVGRGFAKSNIPKCHLIMSLCIDLWWEYRFYTLINITKFCWVQCFCKPRSYFINRKNEGHTKSLPKPFVHTDSIVGGCRLDTRHQICRNWRLFFLPENVDHGGRLSFTTLQRGVINIW